MIDLNQMALFVQVVQAGSFAQAARRLGICLLPGVASSVGNLYVVYPGRRHVPRAVVAFVEMSAQRLPALAPNSGS